MEVLRANKFQVSYFVKPIWFLIAQCKITINKGDEVCNVVSYVQQTSAGCVIKSLKVE